MSSKIQLNIILPIYNEEENLDALILEIIATSKRNNIDPTIVTVNDGSTDETKRVISKYSELISIIYCEHSMNKGYAKSICTGIKEANNGGYLLIMDSDNQFNFNSIIQLLAYREDYDVIIGQRQDRKDNFLRRLLGKVWSLIGRAIFQTRIPDLNCGFKLFKTDLIKKVQIDSKGPGVNLEIFSDPIIKSCLIKKVNIEHYPREFGVQSGASVKTITSSLSDLFVITRKRFF